MTQAGTNSYAYDNNGNMTAGAGRTSTWNGENQPVQIAKVGTPTETYAYDGDTVRIKKAVWGTTTDVSVYVGKVEYRGSQVISTYGGVASRTTTGNPTSTNTGTLVYMHSDHLGSVSMTTSATGSIAQTQEFDPWGAVKSGGITSVSYNYTGQRLDGTGLLFYNARYYDPQLARFTSADSIVPGTSHRALTVDYHESGFRSSQKSEHSQGFWFQLAGSRRNATAPWGPRSSQVLDRYTYASNNPLTYNDPSGHNPYAPMEITSVGVADDMLDRINDALYDLKQLKEDVEGYRDLLGSIVGSLISDLLSLVEKFPFGGLVGTLVDEVIKSKDFGVDDALDMFGFMGEEIQSFINTWRDGASLSIYLRDDSRGLFIVADHYWDRNKEGGHHKTRTRAVERNTFRIFRRTIGFITDDWCEWEPCVYPPPKK